VNLKGAERPTGFGSESKTLETGVTHRGSSKTSFDYLVHAMHIRIRLPVASPRLH
jgi:hypothetical protein